MHTDMLQCKLESLYEDITKDAETGDVVIIHINSSNKVVSVQFA